MQKKERLTYILHENVKVGRYPIPKRVGLKDILQKYRKSLKDIYVYKNNKF